MINNERVPSKIIFDTNIEKIGFSSLYKEIRRNKNPLTNLETLNCVNEYAILIAGRLRSKNEKFIGIFEGIREGKIQITKYLESSPIQGSTLMIDDNTQTIGKLKFGFYCFLDNS